MLRKTKKQMIKAMCEYCASEWETLFATKDHPKEYRDDIRVIRSAAVTALYMLIMATGRLWYYDQDAKEMKRV